MLLRTPAAVTPDKQRTAVGSGVFHARDITGAELSPAEGWSLRRVLAPRLIWRGRRPGGPLLAAPGGCAFFFFPLGPAPFFLSSASPRKERPPRPISSPPL